MLGRRGCEGESQVNIVLQSAELTVVDRGAFRLCTRQGGLPSTNWANGMSGPLPPEKYNLGRQPSTGTIAGPNALILRSAAAHRGEDLKSVADFTVGPSDTVPFILSYVSLCYGGNTFDASLLLIPIVGFLPADDTRGRHTVDAIQRKLIVDGFVMRYDSVLTEDGLTPDRARSWLAASGRSTVSR